jgi:hypothetical protein
MSEIMRIGIIADRFIQKRKVGKNNYYIDGPLWEILTNPGQTHLD